MKKLEIIYEAKKRMKNYVPSAENWQYICLCCSQTDTLNCQYIIKNENKWWKLII